MAVNLDIHSRLPTVRVNVNPHVTLMLDTGSGPNLIKEKFISKEIKINHANILQLNGINNYPVYTFGEIILPLFGIPVKFHMVSDDFPIPQSGILGNDFFKQSLATIDYEQKHLEISGNYIPFSPPETGYSIGDIASNPPNVEDGITMIMHKESNQNNNNNNNKNSGEGSYQTSPEKMKNSEMIGGGSYQTPPEIEKTLGKGSFLASLNPEILGGGNYQTPPEIEETLEGRSFLASSNTPKSNGERSFQISPGKPVDCEEGSNQTSIRKSTQSFMKKQKGRSNLSSLENIKFPRVKTFLNNDNDEAETSHISLRDLIEKAQKYNLALIQPKICKNKKKQPSSMIFNYLKTISKKITNSCKEKREPRNKKSEETQQTKNNHVEKFITQLENEDTHQECLVVCEEMKRDRLPKNTELLRLEHLNGKEKENILNLIAQSQGQFHIPGEKLTATHVLQHQIPTTDDLPINTRQYRFPQVHKEEINRQVEELLAGGIVKYSQSPYNTPVWIVPKKEDSKGNKRWRMVMDFRALNDKTIGDAYPLPNIVDILDQLGGARYFSVCDLASGFHQIKMDAADGHKTAFTTPFGHYEFDRMPFGLKNAPATFQRLMDLVLTGLQGKELFVYMDDIVIYATSLKEHGRKYNALIERLRQANLKLQPDKCEFLKSEVTYLGHIISRDGVKPDPRKLEAVHHFPRPKTPKNIKQFLGLAGYYRKFIPNFSRLAKPLTNLLKNDTPFEWTMEQEASFEKLKQKLCIEPVLQYPDFSRSFILTTDASGIAVGGILSQGEINKDLPIAYASRTLTDNEFKYDTYEKEALAIVYCVKHFRPYLYGRKFTLVTDHKPLMWFKNAQDANMRILRWRLKLAEYDYEVVYKAGKTNVNADALSRNPVNLEETNCKVIRDKEPLDPENLKDAELISEPLEESDCDEDEDEDYDYELYLSDSNPEEIAAEDKGITTNTVSIPFTKEELNEPTIQITEKALIHDPPSRGTRMQTRSRTAKLKEQKETTKSLDDADEIRPLEEKTDPPDKNYIDDNDEDLEKEEDTSRNNQHPTLKAKLKSTIVNNQFNSGNIVDSRELLFLRKDNVAYFVDTKGNPLDSGSQKLFERNALPNLETLILGKTKTIKYKNFYHMVLPVSEGQREGPTLTLTHITTVLNDLRVITDNLKLESLSVAKTDFINNVSWSDVKAQLQLIFSDAPVKLIICNGLVKYPPRDLRPEIIKEMHCLPTGGHRGVTKTYNRIKHSYYWENLKLDVLRHIQQCLQCQLKKLVRVKTKQPMIITDTPGASFDKVAMDIVGPLPKTERGNEYILTLQDQLTKFCMGIPLHNQTAETIAEAFVDRFICVLGAPKTILTDQGRNFISDLMKKIAKIFRIRKFRTTAFHPQSNGSLERSHHALGEYLKQYANEQKQWDRWIGLAMFNYNTNIHEATKHTPYELVFGKIARIPSNEPIASNDKLENYNEYLINLVTQLHIIQGNARENVVSAKIKSKKYYDRKINPQTFKPGDHVFLLRGPKPGKFGDQYTGPHEILEILNRNNVRIRIKKNSRIVHPNRLRISHIKISSN